MKKENHISKVKVGCFIQPKVFFVQATKFRKESNWLKIMKKRTKNKYIKNDKSILYIDYDLELKHNLRDFLGVFPPHEEPI